MRLIDGVEYDMDINSESFQQFAKAITKVKICSCLIEHNKEVVFQYYKNRKMNDKLFQINSVTKSVVSILIGAAIEDGAIDSVHEPISVFFPEIEEGKRDITIEHLLTMTAGFEWGEFGAWGGRPFPMINAKDWVKFTLEQPMETPPGSKMQYNSGCSQLLSEILQTATGMRTEEYAEQRLFRPLGIEEYRWDTNANGSTIGGFGLCLKASDLFKIGQLMLRNGTWGDQQIVSSAWVQQSTETKYITYPHIGAFGYHWWVLLDANQQPYTPHIYFAMGFGGQMLFVCPEWELIVLFTSEMYKDTFFTLRLFRKYILGEDEQILSSLTSLSDTRWQ